MKSEHTIVWNPDKTRYEVWGEWGCVAHSESLRTAQFAYPRAVVSTEAQKRYDSIESKVGAKQ